MAASSPKAKSPVSSPGSGEAAEEIAVDPEFQIADSDSSLGDEVTLSTASISSTILEYRKLHGRTYHNFKDVEYWGPNDEHQNEGLDLNHHMLYLALDNKLFIAPLKDPGKVLDIGTGTGVWAIDFADEFPNSDVLGIDISPTQPSWVPPNCKFELDDATQDWTFPDNHFDYIHLRFMSGCFKDWIKLYRECFRCLKPGGYLEHQDFSLRVRSDDGSLPPDSIWSEWASIFTEAGNRAGQTFEVLDDGNWVRWMEEAGFPNVVTRDVKAPLGTWPRDKKWKEVGLVNRLGVETSLEGYTLYLLTNVMGWEYNEVQTWLVRVRQALKNKEYHAYSTWGIAYAQKPEVE